jgi:nitroreductase
MRARLHARSHTTPAERPLSALDAIYVRRSVRTFTPERIDGTTVRALLDAAVQAPTAMHEQPWTFAVVQDHAVLDRLSDLAKARWQADASHAALAARVADRHGSVFHEAHTLILIGVRDIGPFAVADCWLAAENLMLAACALGLGTCVIGSALPAINTPEGKAAAGIPVDITVVAPIVVGVPARATAAVARRDPEIVAWK